MDDKDSPGTTTWVAGVAITTGAALGGVAATTAGAAAGGVAGAGPATAISDDESDGTGAATAWGADPMSPPATASAPTS
jgi:hypothetical protein